jgi:hypothetical protein
MPREPRPAKPTANRPPTVKAIKAKCKECTNGYVDGRHDCGIPTCSLYYFMPYRTLVPEWKPEPKRELPPERRAAIADRLMASRSRSKRMKETTQTGSLADQEE